MRCKHSPADNGRIDGPPDPRIAHFFRARHAMCRQLGFTLAELLIALLIAALIMAGLGGVIGQALQAENATRERNELTRQARFAMQRMVGALHGTQRLLLPLGENPATAWSESVRDVLAVTLDPSLDRDGDGFADADNDKDGIVDEDVGADNSADNASGLFGIDDDGDGQTDESNAEDDDEDEDNAGTKDEDPINGLDDDADGSVDEDIGSDMNGDLQPGIAGIDDDGDSQTDESNKEDDDEDEDDLGTKDEDWFDPVVYYLSGTTLLERMPNLNPVDGRDFTERVVAEGVSQFQVQRIAQGVGRAVLVDLTLELTGASGEAVSLHSRIRLGGGL